MAKAAKRGTVKKQSAVDRLAELSALDEIRLMNSHAEQGELRVQETELKPVVVLPRRIAANAQIETSLSKPLKRWRVTVSFSLVMSYDDAPDQAAIIVMAKYRMAFSVSDVKAATEKSLGEFSTGPALFIIWPYWRQHVTAMLSQMNLPSYNLPLYRDGFFQEAEQIAVTPGRSD